MTHCSESTFLRIMKGSCCHAVCKQKGECLHLRTSSNACVISAAVAGPLYIVQYPARWRFSHTTPNLWTDAFYNWLHIMEPTTVNSDISENSIKKRTQTPPHCMSLLNKKRTAVQVSSSSRKFHIYGFRLASCIFTSWIFNTPINTIVEFNNLIKGWRLLWITTTEVSITFDR